MVGPSDSDDARRFQPEAERVFPHLTDAQRNAQRKAREGFVTLPLTAEMRARERSLSMGDLVGGYLIFAGIPLLIIGSILLVLHAGAVVFVLALLAIPLYFVYARWSRAAQVAHANRLTTYARFTPGSP